MTTIELDAPNKWYPISTTEKLSEEEEKRNWEWFQVPHPELRSPEVKRRPVQKLRTSNLTELKEPVKQTNDKARSSKASSSTDNHSNKRLSSQTHRSRASISTDDKNKRRKPSISLSPTREQHNIEGKKHQDEEEQLKELMRKHNSHLHRNKPNNRPHEKLRELYEKVEKVKYKELVGTDQIELVHERIHSWVLAWEDKYKKDYTTLSFQDRDKAHHEISMMVLKH
ncbi:hypothetical protein THRCLA_04906 [Thraustotheca clavata]|uniref:Uncharacterized protein n=1 Tax=Thraustotheca clavata TaxID=74557 RepID=A0A1V9ZXM4_9STRA|nr:hypothetical protein THRCLA_04906 [Thraustotheca clavata]